MATSDASLDDLSTFGTPMAVEGLSLAGFDDDDPELSADQLELYFTSNRQSTGTESDIWRAVREDISQPFGPPERVVELSSVNDDTQPSLCCGDLGMVFGSSRPPAVMDSDLFFAIRTSRDAPWSTPVHIAELAFAGYDAGGTQSLDGLEMFLDSARENGTRRLLHVTTRASTSMPWSAPQLVPLGTPATRTDVDPFLVSDIALVFSSSRVGPSFDLWIARRPALDHPFGAPEPISIANSSADERDPWLAADGRTLYFARRSAAGDYDIMMSSR